MLHKTCPNRGYNIMLQPILSPNSYSCLSLAAEFMNNLDILLVLDLKDVCSKPESLSYHLEDLTYDPCSRHNFV